MEDNMDLHKLIHKAWEDALVDAARQSQQDDLMQVQGNYIPVQTNVQAGHNTVRC